MTKKHFIICGTPGVGKSTISRKVADRLSNSIDYITLNDVALEIKAISDYDESRKSHVLDETKLRKHFRKMFHSDSNKSLLIEYHDVVGLFPSKYFEKVFVVTVPNTGILFARLNSRKYEQSKINENIQCEIFREIADSSAEAFGSKVVELVNETKEQLDDNVSRIVQVIRECLNT